MLTSMAFERIAGRNASNYFVSRGHSSSLRATLYNVDNGFERYLGANSF